MVYFVSDNLTAMDIFNEVVNEEKAEKEALDQLGLQISIDNFHQIMIREICTNRV